MPQAQAMAIPTRWPLIIDPGNRDEETDKDAKLVNCYVETQKRGEETEYWIYKRAGYVIDTTHSATGAGRGNFNWLGDIYYVFAGTLYKNGVSIGTVNATNGLYHFTSTLGDSTLGFPPYLVFGNGVAAYYYDGTTLLQITDVDFPTSFVKGWAYMDGYLYVMRPDATIQGSAYNNPASWDSINAIKAQIEPDLGVGFEKQLVYAIAFKEWTTEVFFDAGNATGSPLGPVQGAKVGFGCANGDSIQRIDDILIWLSVTRSSALQVVMMEGLKAHIVSTKPIERLLDHADATTVFSWQFKDEGHAFYGVTLKNANLTLVYDMQERTWCQWTDVNGNYFPFVAATYDSQRRHLFQHETSGKTYFLDRDYTSDSGSIITVDIITPNFDANTQRKKMLGMMFFLADRAAGSVLQVRKNDSDYDATKWSAYRTVDLSSDKPRLANNGSFSRRAYQFRHQSNTALRIRSVDLQLDLGTV